MIARAVGTMGEVEAQLAATRVQIDAVMQRCHDECAEIDRLRATIERHEAQARVHAEERAAMHAEVARVTGENERLRAALAVATRSLEAATTGERLTTCDEVARLSREVAIVTRERDEARDEAEAETHAHMNCGAAFEMLRRERDEARAALREYALRCAECDDIATRRLDGYGCVNDGVRCDAHSNSAAEHPWCHELEHAAALRAATVTP